MKDRTTNPAWNLLLRAQRVILVVTCAALTLIISGACILRFFGINFVGFEELATLVAFWLYMIGCGHGSYEKSQITADIVELLLPESKGKELMRVFKWVLTFILGVIFAFWAFQLLMWSLQTNSRTPAFRFPIAWIQASILVGLVISSFYNLVYLKDEVLIFLGKKEKPVPDGTDETGEGD